MTAISFDEQYLSDDIPVTVYTVPSVTAAERSPLTTSEDCTGDACPDCTFRDCDHICHVGRQTWTPVGGWADIETPEGTQS